LISANTLAEALSADLACNTLSKATLPAGVAPANAPATA
jgi:hypothetical protein